MDHSITLITPEYWRERGAEAFDLGLSQDDHNMNPGSAAIRDWQAGWHQRRIECKQKRERQAAAAKVSDACAEMRALCSACGGSGDVHSLDGEWRGRCDCEASAWSRTPLPVREAAHG